MNLHDDELTRRLHHSTDAINSRSDLSDIVRRGRANVRRNRTIASVAGVACAGAVWAGGVGLANGIGDGSNGPTTAATELTSYADTTSQPPEPPPTDANCPTRAPGEGTSTAPAPTSGGDLDEFRSVLNGYRDVLVSHLDPNETHLQSVEGVQNGYGAPGCKLNTLGTKLGWTEPGQTGLGVVAIEVSTSWADSQIRLAHDDWQPATSLPTGATAAYVALEPDGIAVAVTRTDDVTVAIDADSLFGNDSLTPVSGMNLAQEQLLEMAVDPAFQLPD